jgi:ribosomal protein S18 acetylase RimI-like enzyme
MVASLEPLAEEPMAYPVRHPVPGDTEELAELMLEGYRDTIDADGSETLADARSEVTGFLSGSAGEPLLDHSYLAVDGERIVSALLVSRFEGVPLIAYAFTAPDYKGRGLAGSLTQRGMASLHAAGERQAHLWVTAGNTMAERIYERLGFRDVKEP